MADKFDINDRRAVKRQASDDQIDSTVSLTILNVSENSENPKDDIKRWKSCCDETSTAKPIENIENRKTDNASHPYFDNVTTSVSQVITTEDQNDDEENNDDDHSDDDRVSEISGMSDVSVSGTGRWHPVSRAMLFVRRQMSLGSNPRAVLRTLLPHETDSDIPDDLDDMTLWRLIISLVSGPPRRHRLTSVSTLDDVVRLLHSCTKIIVLTGAGVSVSCGIPDFRSANGIYSRLAVDYPDLPNPQAMFDIAYFKRNPRPFFQFAKEIYPGQFTPSTCHRFIHSLELHGKLLRNYTQNIDTLEQSAGITHVVQCHGSFATATCMVCRHQVDSDAIRDDVLNQVTPMCPRCDTADPKAILKPDIVFFGESLPEDFHRHIQMDKDECDLLIVIGSSLKVQPVALIPSSLPAHVPQILINREPLRHIGFDVELLGDCDVIVNELCHRLGEDKWKAICTTAEAAVEIPKEAAVASLPVGKPNISSELGNNELVCSSDGQDSVLGLQSELDDGSNSDHLVTSSGDHEQVSKEVEEQARCESSDERGHRARRDSSGPVEHGHHRRHSDRRDSSGTGVASNCNHLKVSSDEQSKPSDMVVTDRTDANTVETITERNQVLETIQRHDQDLHRTADAQPVNWASLLADNKFMCLGPRRYIFSGAEVCGEVNESSSDDDEEDESMSSSVEDEDSEVEDALVNGKVVHCQVTESSSKINHSASITPVDLANVESSEGSLDP